MVKVGYKISIFVIDDRGVHACVRACVCGGGGSCGRQADLKRLKRDPNNGPTAYKRIGNFKSNKRKKNGEQGGIALISK